MKITNEINEVISEEGAEAHTCNPSYLGGIGRRFQARLI
jgi:hypothetical protein